MSDNLSFLQSRRLLDSILIGNLGVYQLIKDEKELERTKTANIRLLAAIIGNRCSGALMDDATWDAIKCLLDQIPLPPLEPSRKSRKNEGLPETRTEPQVLPRHRTTSNSYHVEKGSMTNGEMTVGGNFYGCCEGGGPGASLPTQTNPQAMTPPTHENEAINNLNGAVYTVSQGSMINGPLHVRGNSIGYMKDTSQFSTRSKK